MILFLFSLHLTVLLLVLLVLPMFFRLWCLLIVIKCKTAIKIERKRKRMASKRIRKRHSTEYISLDENFRKKKSTDLLTRYATQYLIWLSVSLGRFRRRRSSSNGDTAVIVSVQLILINVETYTLCPTKCS